MRDAVEGSVRRSPDGWLIRLRWRGEQRQGRRLNSAKKPTEPLDRPELLLAPARPRPVHPRSGTSNALLPSGPSVTASACRLNTAPPAWVVGRRSAPACAGIGGAEP